MDSSKVFERQRRYEEALKILAGISFYRKLQVWRSLNLSKTIVQAIYRDIQKRKLQRIVS